MDAQIHLGIDFGSTGYRVAGAIDDRIVSLPGGPWSESHSGWIALSHSTSANNSFLQFPSIKYCLEKKQPIQTLLGNKIPVHWIVQIFEEIKLLVESYSDCKIGKTVIAVPATYTESRRAMLLAAAKKAGLGQPRLINDALAVTMNFVLQQPKDACFLVYGAGYTQCEIAVVQYISRRFRALGYGSIDRPCGRILDDAILTGCIRALQEVGLGDHLQAWSPQQWLQLQQSVQKIKEALNSRADVHLPINLGEMETVFYLPIQRLIFESLLEQLMQENLRLVDKTIQEAQLTPQDISQAIATGGTVKLTKVQQSLEKHFAGCPLQVSTDDAIARGAAIFAADLIDTQAIDSMSAKPMENSAATAKIGTSFLSLEIKKTVRLPPQQEPEIDRDSPTVEIPKTRETLQGESTNPYPTLGIHPYT